MRVALSSSEPTVCTVSVDPKLPPVSKPSRKMTMVVDDVACVLLLVSESPAPLSTVT